MEQRTSAEILARMAARRREIARLEAEESADLLALQTVREAETAHHDRRRRELEGSATADEVAVVLGTTTNSVQGRMIAARTVRDRLPAIWRSHRDGSLDAWRLRLIAQAAERLAEKASWQRLDADLADRSARMTVGQLRAWLRRFVLRAEPDGSRERRARQLDDRGVWLRHGDDGVSLLEAVLPTEQAFLIDRELSLAATDATRGDARTRAQGRADVLVDRLLGPRQADGGPRGRFHIGITVSAASLAGLDDEPATTADGSLALEIEALREAALEPGTLFSRLVTDERGGVLDVGEVGRFPSAVLRRSLELIDGVCAFPTCSIPATAGDADHVVPHPRGPTEATNLVHLCRRHHRMKTAGVLRTRLGTDGVHRWRLPSGVTTDSVLHVDRAWATTSPLEVDLRRLADAA